MFTTSLLWLYSVQIRWRTVDPCAAEIFLLYREDGYLRLLTSLGDKPVRQLVTSSTQQSETCELNWNNEFSRESALQTAQRYKDHPSLQLGHMQRVPEVLVSKYCCWKQPHEGLEMDGMSTVCPEGFSWILRGLNLWIAVQSSWRSFVCQRWPTCQI